MKKIVIVILFLIEFQCFQYLNAQITIADEDKFHGKLGEAHIERYAAFHSELDCDYEMALIHSIRALEYAIKIVGNKSEELVLFLSELGYYHGVNENYQEAIQIYSRAIEIKARTSLPNNAGLFYFRAQRAHLLLNLRDTTGAEREISFIRLEDLKKKDVDLEVLYESLSIYYARMASFDSSKIYLKYAFDLSNKTYSDSAYYFRNLADVEFSLGKFEHAKNLYLLALRIDSFECEFTGLLEYTVPEIVGLVKSYGRLNQWDSAARYLLMAIRISNMYINESIGYKGDQISFGVRARITLNGITNRLKHSPFNIAEQSDLLIDVYRYAGEKEVQNKFVLHFLLSRKDISTEAFAFSMNNLRDHIAPHNRHLYEELLKIYSSIKVNSLQSQDNKDIYPWKRKTSIESELLNSDQDLSPKRKMESLNLLEGLSQVPENGAVLFYFIYKPLFKENYGSDERYVAFLLEKSGNIIFKEIGSVRYVDSLIEDWRMENEDYSLSEEEVPNILDTTSLLIYSILLKPFESYLQTHSQLFISTEGRLGVLPFSALRYSHNAHLIQKLKVSYISPGFFYPIKPSLISTGEDVVVANPYYGIVDSKSRFIKLNGVARPLPLTQIVADSIQASNSSVLVYLGKEATTSRVKSIKNPRILMLATHGFFHDEIYTDYYAKDKSFDIPFLKCGLVFSGVNEFEDSLMGVLTGLEVIGMDLRGTELVILSACQTGIGSFHNRESMYSLGRAFELAGSKSQVTSLWDVPEEATIILMTSFYNNLLRGDNKMDALRNAQLKVKGIKKYHLPYFWAGFCLRGDIGTIPQLNNNLGALDLNKEPFTEDSSKSVKSIRDSIELMPLFKLKEEASVVSLAATSSNLFVGSNKGILYALDTATNSLIWEFDIKSVFKKEQKNDNYEFRIFQILVVNGKLLLNTGKGLLMLDPLNAKLIWKMFRPYYVPQTIYLKDSVLICAVFDEVMLIDAFTGNVLANLSFGEHQEDIDFLYLKDNALYIATSELEEDADNKYKEIGRIYMLDTKTWFVKKRIRCNPVNGAFTSFDSFLIIPIDNKLVKFTDKLDSLQELNIETKVRLGYSYNSAIICEDTAYYVEMGRLFAVNIVTGKVLWQYTVSEYLNNYSSPKRYKSYIIFSYSDLYSGALCVYNVNSGKVFTHKFEDTEAHFPLNINGNLYITTKDGSLYKIKFY